MQLLKKKVKEFDIKAVEAALSSENKFITELFAKVPFPKKEDSDDEEDESEVDQLQEEEIDTHKKTSRAASIADLQERLQKVRGKPKLTYKEKVKKKNIKNRIKKKTKTEERNVQHKLLRAQKVKGEIKTENGVQNGEAKPSKPVFNSEGKMVFSKFDFSGLGKEEKGKKQVKDPTKILENLKKQKEKLEQLEASGEADKAVQIREKTAWKVALAKAEGEKVKDDPILLKKTIKRKEQQTKKSKKNWEQRIQTVQKAKDERQQKRKENIDKRKKEKKTKKIKKAVKRGRIVPGF